MTSNGTLRPGMIFGLGNPLLDISADVTSEFLAKWSLPANSAILAEDKHKGLIEDMIASFRSSIKYTAGGATQNSLRVAQWMLQTPNVCSFTGCVSNDKFGDEMKKKAIEDGVNVQYMITTEDGTGYCAVCITGLERSLCAYLGAANLFKMDHLDTIWSIVEGSDLFYVSGFHLTVSPESILKLANHASAHSNKHFAFNLSAPFISQFFGDRLLKVLPLIDILFGNETEAAAFASMMKWDSNLTVRQIAEKFSKEIEKKNKSKPRLIIITQGSDPAIIVKEVVSKENGDERVVIEFSVQKIDKKNIVDTNGAGDAFVGGFLSQFVQKKPLETCLKAAVFAATRIIQESGCTFPKECDFKE